MKRILMTVVMLVLASFALTACATGTEEAGTATASAQLATSSAAEANAQATAAIAQATIDAANVVAAETAAVAETSAAAELADAQATADAAATSLPATDAPTAEAPATEEATAEEPTEESAATEEVTEEAATEEATAEEPAAEATLTNRQATATARAETSAAEVVATEVPAEEPTEEVAATEVPTEEVTEEAATEEATEEAATEEPTAEVAATEVPAAEGIISVCLVTDLGRVNDGTFNQYAYEGMVRAAEDLNLDSRFIETVAQTDYEANIATCVDEGFQAIITVGFLIADATAAAAAANPDVAFIGVDQFHANPLPNLVGIQFREDQAGFLVGALAAQVTETGKIAGVYGIDIPPVRKFRNGFEQGARYVNPDIEIAGVYIPDFVAPQLGAEAAEQFVADGFDVIFGAGGPTGSGGIVRAAELGAYVIGVDQDEWFTTFGAGETPGADRIITSALKRVDQGVYDMVALLAGGAALPANSLYLMDAAVNGVGFAPAHDAVVSEEVTTSVQEIFTMLASGDLTTGVDPVTGDLVDAEAAEPTDETAEEPAGVPTIAEAAIATPDLSILVELVTEAGLVDVLSNPDGTFTVFAPTNDAFAAVPADVLEALRADPALLTRVL
nr:BMP family ABC transporter substrate-binding protein [Anaerolineae bacterium]